MAEYRALPERLARTVPTGHRERWQALRVAASQADKGGAVSPFFVMHPVGASPSVAGKAFPSLPEAL